MSEHNNITQHSTSSYIGVDYDEVRVYRVMYVEELEAESDRQAIAIRAAIKKLDGPGMPDRAREAIHILTEAVDD